MIRRCGLSFVALALFSFFAAATTDSNSGSSSGPAATAVQKVSDTECMKSLKCWAEKHTVAAEVRCKEPVERLAKNNFEWTEGFLEPKFSHYRWRNAATCEVTYVGDKIKFQNGFGAWVFHTYECDLDASGERVTGVRASAGRMR